MLALRISDGSYVWHYQTTPGDSWDFTATEHMILADLEIAGRPRKVIMQAPKNGFFYVVDRVTGEFLSAKPIATVTWATGIDPLSGRPIEAPGSRYEKEPWTNRPTNQGAHNWQPMAYHPPTGFVYIPVQEHQQINTHDPDWKPSTRGMQRGNLIVRNAGFEPTGQLLAWDPRTQKEVWRVNQANHANGGVLATAGNLVFQGTGDGRLVAYDARDGKMLWDWFLGLAILAPPVSYRVDGKQHVLVAAGLGGGVGLRFGGPAGEAAKHEQIGRVFAFVLGGAEKIPLPPPRIIRKPIGHEIALSTSPAQLANGQKLYIQNCISCHSMAYAHNPGILPDLRLSLKETLTDIFPAIVYDGAYAAAKGMPSFKDVLSKDDVESIRAYIVTESKKLAASAP
jgi:mono/diheme cytochrome c family protein